MASFSPDVQTILQQIRLTIRQAAPEARETIGYNIPAFTLDGTLVYFAAFKKHIGFYPPVRGDAKLEKSVSIYAGEKGNLKFPLDRPIPLDLIRKIVKLRVKQSSAKAGAPRKGKKPDPSQGEQASELISKKIAELGDWRGETLGRMRRLIREADPCAVEEWKWRGTPVWSHDGIVCTGESYKNVVKLTFARGASLKDPARLFNSSLDGNTRRAIDIREGEKVDESAFKALVRQAVALNSSAKSKPSRKAKS
jgi:hypothetical protein